MQLPCEFDERCCAGAPGKQAFGAKTTAQWARGEVAAWVPAGEQPSEAHHDEYASARANLDDSLGLLANIVSVYERADDANRRLCNQAFFHRIFIEEDGDVRVEYERPFGSLCDTEEQMNALNWAAEAKKKGEAQTGQRVVTLVEGLNLSHLGWLTGLEPATTGTTSRCSTN